MSSIFTNIIVFRSIPWYLNFHFLWFATFHWSFFPWSSLLPPCLFYSDEIQRERERKGKWNFWLIELFLFLFHSIRWIPRPPPLWNPNRRCNLFWNDDRSIFKLGLKMQRLSSNNEQFEIVETFLRPPPIALHIYVNDLTFGSS